MVQRLMIQGEIGPLYIPTEEWMMSGRTAHRLLLLSSVAKKMTFASVGGSLRRDRICLLPPLLLAHVGADPDPKLLSGTSGVPKVNYS